MTFIEPRTLDLLGDATFVDQLLQFKKITNCSVGCPSRDSAKGTGKSAFPEYFLAIQTARTRTKSAPLCGLLVLTDADGNADESFKEVANALERSAFPKPSRAFEVTEEAGFRVAVYLVPGEGETGTLEHVLLRAALAKSPHLGKCLADFSACTGGLSSTKPNAQAKMRMSALAAAFCEDNPWCSSNTLWHDKNNPVPIDSACFDSLSQFLAKFSA